MQAQTGSPVRNSYSHLVFMADSRKHVLVLGAGVIGLSTALRLQDKYNVTVVADVLPGDERKGQAQYANAWAVRRFPVPPANV